VPPCRGVAGWRAPVCPEAGGGGGFGGARLGRLRSRGRRCEVETELCACPCLEVYRGPGQTWADALGVARSRPDINRPYRRASTVRVSGHQSAALHVAPEVV